MPDPDYLGRDECCGDDVTLETCYALRFNFVDPPLTSVIVWRDKPRFLRPVEKGKRISELAPGDEVELRGQRYVIEGVEIFR